MKPIHKQNMLFAVVYDIKIGSWVHILWKNSIYALFGGLCP